MTDQSTSEGVTLPDGEYGQILWPSEAAAGIAHYAEHADPNCHVTDDPYPVGCLCGYDAAMRRQGETEGYAEDVIRAAHAVFDAAGNGSNALGDALVKLGLALANEGFDQ